MKDFVKKILVAINGTENSIHAAMYAIMLAKSYNAQLKFIYVVDSATIRYLGINKVLIKEEQQDFTTDLNSEGKNSLDYAKSLARLKGLNAETELLKGNVSTQIVLAAEKYKADILILGGKEKTKANVYHSPARNVLSTHRTEVLLNAKCPVLMVQKPDIESLFKLF